MNARTFGLGLVAAALMITAVAAQSPSASDLYFEALRQQEIKGDIAKAIETYKSIVDRYPSDPIVPKALLELATCYETTRQPEAPAVYARIVRDFGGTSAATTARARMAGLDQRAPAVSMRQVWAEAADRVSPDGKYLSFTDWETGDLAIRELSSNRTRRVTNNGKWNDDFAEMPIPSSSGKLIMYTWFSEKTGAYDLRVISRDGGEPTVVVEGKKGVNMSTVGWMPGEKQLVYVHFESLTNKQESAELRVVSVTGRDRKTVTRLPASFRAPRLSPAGDFVAFDAPAGPGKPERDLQITSLSDGSTWALAPHPSSDNLIDWSPSGDRILFGSDRGGKAELWSIPVVKGRANGNATMVHSGLGLIASAGLTTKGDFYYVQIKQDAGVRMATLDAAGKTSGSMTRLEGRYQTGQTQAAWSPDGRQLAYVQATKFDTGRPARSGASDKSLAIQTPATGEIRLYDIGMINMQRPAWSPDGKTIFLQGNTAQDGQGIYRVDLATGQLAAVVTKGATNPQTEPSRQWPGALADGRSLVFLRTTPEQSAGSLVVRDLAAGTERVILSDVNNFALSPDGRWIVAKQRTAKDGRMTILPVTGGEGRAILENTKVEVLNPLAWSADSRFIYMFKQGESDRQLWRVSSDGGAATDTGIRISAGPINGLSVDRDGRIAISSDQVSTTTWVMTGLFR